MLNTYLSVIFFTLYLFVYVDFNESTLCLKAVFFRVSSHAPS